MPGHRHRAGKAGRKLIGHRSNVAHLIATSLLAVGVLEAAIAADDTYEPDRIEFVVGNLVFVSLHELAHAVIEDFDVPVLGNGEDAADTLAAVTLIRMDREHPEGDFRRIRMLLMAADANRILWQRGLEKDNPLTYLARHPLSVQRAARIACLAYGSDPESREPLPELVGLPEFRAFWCEEEYEQAENAWTWVRDSLIANEPSRHAREHEFSYGPTTEPRHAPMREWLVQNSALELALAFVSRNMLLRDAIMLRTKSCGSPDAYWDGNTRELVVCYQLIDAFYQLSAEQSVKDLEEKIRNFHRNDRETGDNQLSD